MSDRDEETPTPEGETPAEETTSNAPPGRERPDPRLRPPDPAGTQPTWDPDDLLPKETPRAAAGRLWATAAQDEDGSAEDEAGAATATAHASVAGGEPALVGAAAPAATAVPAPAGDADADAATRHSRYSARFQFLLGALLAIGAAAIALLVAVLVGGQDDTKIVVKSGPAWSDWRPTATGGVDAAEQIAKHVGAQYKLPSGKQLVLVTGGALEVQQVPVTIAIQQPAAQGGSVDLVDDGAGVLYRLNGVGTTDGHIPGKPSPARLLLLRREALELALYSFRYLGVSETVVMLPPTFVRPSGTGASASGATSGATSGTGMQPTATPTALLFRRNQSDVQSALARPLESTLSEETPSVSGVTRAADARRVSAITTDKAYTYKLQEANTDLRLYLVLNPIRLP